MDLTRFTLRNDKVIVFVVGVLAALGVGAYFATPRSIFPTMSFSKVEVVADAGDLPAEQVRVAVTQPLERALQTLPSVERVASNSSQGSADITVEFSPKTDPGSDLDAVNQAIAQVRSSLPAADNIVAVVINPNSEPVLSYALTSHVLSQAVLREFATHTIVPALYGTPGLGRLHGTGRPTTEFHVTLDPASLAAHGLGASDVVKAVADANNVRAVGIRQSFYQRYALLVDASLHDTASLGQIVVPDKNGAATALTALGTISLGVSPIADQASIDGTHAVIVNAYAVAGADTVKMAADVSARLGAAQRHLPGDVHLKKFWDQTTLIVESQKALRDAILLGALLAIVVIYAFLRNGRLTLTAAAVIPLAMAIAIFALGRAGETLNLMSVGGLAVAVGLIIDDAIVVIENIARNAAADPDAPRAQTISRAMSQVAGPMTASTATTVVVFVPLALLGGVTGYFFRSLAFTLAASLLVSLALAIFVAPIIAFRLSKRGGEHTEHRLLTRALAQYEPLLRWALSHRRALYAGVAVTLLVTVSILSLLPSDFLPKMDEGQFEIAYTMPTGTTLSASDAAASRMEQIVTSDPAVEAVGRLTGIDSNGYSPTPANQGLLRVALVPEGTRPGFETVSSRLRERLQAEVPAATYDFHQILEDLINGLSGTPAPVEIVVRGADQQRLIALAGQISNRIAKIPGVVDAFNGVVYDSPSLRIVPRGTRLAALGLGSGDVGDALAALSQGTVATQIPGVSQSIPVRVSVASPSVQVASLADQPLYAKGGATALGDLARILPDRLASDISAENGQRLLRVTANIEGQSLSAVVAHIRTALGSVPLPPGYSVEIGGRYRVQQSSFREFLTVIAVAVALVFAVMLATFRSYRLPLVILTAIPPALIGVALALAITRTPFNVSSFMGLLLLVGIVVKNGILLIDVANKQRRQGAPIEEALVTAGRTRLRPIVMTTLAAIGGLLPLAIGIGQGAEMERPLAIAVIGGLSTATVFTLLVIPVLYAALVGTSPPRSAQEARL